MRRVFKTKFFQRLMKKSGLTDKDYCRAVAEMERGLIDADLGGGVIKKRVALPGRGKSGGARALVATNHRNRWFFIFGFHKSDKANISSDELAALKMLAKDFLSCTDHTLDRAIVRGELTEICNERQD